MAQTRVAVEIHVQVAVRAVVCDAFGLSSPTVTLPTTLSVAPSSAVRLFEPPFATYTSPFAVSRAAASGLDPTMMVAIGIVPLTAVGRTSSVAEGGSVARRGATSGEGWEVPIVQFGCIWQRGNRSSLSEPKVGPIGSCTSLQGSHHKGGED